MLREWKMSFEIGSLRCVKYSEKKPNLTILTSLKSHIFFMNHGSQHLTLFQKTFLASPLELLALNWWFSGPTKIIKLRPVLFSIKNTFLEVVDPSYLNCSLVDGHLNICILVLWFNDFYVLCPNKIPVVCLSIHQFSTFLRNESLVFLISDMMVNNWNI